MVESNFLIGRLIFSTVLLVFLSGCLHTDNMEDLKAFVAATKNKSYGENFKPLPKIEPYRPFTYTAEGLKDPFALSSFIVDALAREEIPVFDNGVKPNLDRPREELENYALGSLQMVGTFQDFNSVDLWALVRAPDGIVHRVRKGNYMGQNFGHIYNITEDRVDLQEIVPDDLTGGWKEKESFLSLTQ